MQSSQRTPRLKVDWQKGVKAVEGVVFILGSLAFLSVLTFSLMRVFTAMPHEEAALQIQESVGPAAKLIVVGGGGVCSFGAYEGDLVIEGSVSTCTPEQCQPAEAIVSLAKAAGGSAKVQNSRAA